MSHAQVARLLTGCKITLGIICRKAKVIDMVKEYCYGSDNLFCRPEND